MRIVIVLAVSLLAGCFSSDKEMEPPASPEIAVEWNALVLRMAEAEDGFMTLKGLRTTTMMHLAMHDALNSIYGLYEPYTFDSPADEVDALAAAVEAAYRVALDQYPDQRASLDQLRTKSLGLPGDDATLQRGFELGRAAAAEILERRDSDGWNQEADYTWHPMGPGVYAEFNEHSGTPEGFVFGAGWAAARPFAMSAFDQFVSPLPPEIDSPAYKEAFDEVKRVGRFQSETRTEDQTHLALWWKDFAENSHNRLARSLVMKEQLNLVDAVRLFALLNMNIYDGYISSFYNKFLYNHWRPYTAIRWAEHDGNPDTEPELDWDNTHRHTYAFPSYPSAHGTVCAAAMTAMAETFGDEYAFEMRTERVDVAGPFSGKMNMEPPTRSFDRFSDAAMECGMSRVYLGIHFRYDSVEGVALGKKVGEHAVNTKLMRVSNTGG